jgi:prevent-host-death family protein
MRAVSIRQLSKNASGVIRQVRSGETVQVVSNRMVVAVIVPVSQPVRGQAVFEDDR